MKHSAVFRGFLVLGLSVGLLVGCSRDPEVRKQKYLESGQRYMQKGKYREAVIQFGNAVQVDPRYAEGHYQLAQAYLKLQNWNLAFQELERTVQVQPANMAAHVDMANLLIAARQFKQAQEHIDAVFGNNPNNPQAHMAEANLKAGQQDFSGALREMQNAVQLAPDQWDFYLNRAVLQVRMNQFDAAEADFKKAAVLNPQAINVQLALGAFYEQRARVSDAEQSFQHAMQIDPKSPDPVVALARLYLAEGRQAEAEELLRKSKDTFRDNPVGYRMLGDYYFALGDLDKATTEYASLYSKFSNDLQIKKNYIQILILKNRLDDANKLNDEILKANRDDAEGLIYRGQIEIRQGREREAAETLQQALHTDPENGVAHYHLGVAFSQMGHLARAESEWRDAVRLRPDLAEAQKSLALAEANNSEWDALAQTAGQMINRQPNLPDGYALRAISAINRKQLGKAEDDLRTAMQVAPQSPVGYIHMGNLRFRQKQYNEAQKYYEQALEHDPNSADALAGVINIYLAQKQPEKAIARVQAQLAQEPSNSNYHYLAGVLLFNNKDMKAADSELRKAVDLDKNNADALLKLGQVQVAEGSADQALATYQAHVQSNPNDFRFYILMGELYESKSDWDKAKDMYQRALQVQPDNPLASNNLAYVMLEHGGNVDVATSMAQVARRGMPDSPNAADTLGWAYYNKRAYNLAIDLFKQAIKLTKDDPEDPTFYYHLGLAYQQSNQPALAKQQFERALKINPSFSNANDARKLLAQLR